jgi:molecular chaperone DnaK
VAFDIDANGILHVSARDKASGKEQKVTITASTNLNKADVERMVNEARQHEVEDRNRRELIDARNSAESLAYQLEKTLNELGDQVPGFERRNIQDKLEKLREVVKGERIVEIRDLQNELQNAFHALSQQLHARQASSPGEQATYQSGNGQSKNQSEDGEILEGEYHSL